tara:strand:- start:363 stop:1316 length:954 start_codon:yes stop_codon:yes gene_type:complete
MQGEAYKAIKLTVLGGLISVIVITITSPLFVATLPIIYATIKQYIGFILIAILGFIIIFSKKYVKTIFIISLAGLLGIISTQIMIFQNTALFPLLTGLFAFPMLITQIKHQTHIPEQIIDISEHLLNKENILSATVGSLAGMFSGLLPGVGASQAAIITSPTAGLRKTKDSFLVRIGAITTSNIILSFLALWLISKPRSGAAVAVQQLISGIINFGLTEFLFILPIILISAAIAAVTTLFLAKLLIRNISKINYVKLSLAVLILLNILILILTGPIGFILSWTACIIGIITIKLNVLRTSLIAALIIPTALFYLGML